MAAFWPLWQWLLGCLSLALLLSCAVARHLASIPDAAGVALSADASTAYVMTEISALYIISLPVNLSSLNASDPQPYYTEVDGWRNLESWSFIAASVSSAPQLVWLLDNYHAQLLPLNVSAPAPSSPTLVYSFGAGQEYNVDGLYHQASTSLLYFSCYGQFNGSAVETDFVGVLDPYAASPVLDVFYSTPFVDALAGLAVDADSLFFGTVSSFHGQASSIYRVPLPYPGALFIPSSTAPILLYETTNPNWETAVLGSIVFPAAFALDSTSSVLFFSDLGNVAEESGGETTAVYALADLRCAPALNLTVLFSSQGQERQIQPADRPDGRWQLAVLPPRRATPCPACGMSSMPLRW